MIAEMIEATLEEEGLAATLVHSGVEAMSALAASPDGYQVLITDIRIGAPPNGWEIAHVAREANPAIAVVYITGDSMEDWRANGVPDSIVIGKPFVPGQIVTAVMTLLNQSSGGMSR